MLIDSNQVEHNSTLKTDLCIIGSGAAGVTLAREMKAHGDVILVESGGLDFNMEVYDLNRGSVSGKAWSATMASKKLQYMYLQTTRHSFFGGSTNCWTGFCRPLEASVFENRAWIPHSGWPITRSDLDHYYPQAAILCEVSEQYAQHEQSDGRQFKFSSDLRPAKEHKSPPTRFGIKYRDEILQSKTIRTYINGTVTNLICNAVGDTVERVEIKTIAGNSYFIEAGRFILATGGLENPRILLNANKQHKKGLGNENDVVGRFFMEHLYPKVRPGLTALSAVRWTGNDKFDEFGIWTFTPEVRKQHALLNVGIAFESTEKNEAYQFAQSVLSTSKAIDYDSVTNDNTHYDSIVTRARLHIELSPNPDNRVTLSEERDKLGMQRLNLHWQFSELDKHSIYKSVDLFALELGKSGNGRMSIGRLSLLESFGAHHIGTTRMGNDPKISVVDANCKMHELTNLYIAGSSVFPTAGFENPTFTIVALALRLADHLRAS